MNEFAFTQKEMQTMLYAPPVHLDSVRRCSAHREALLLSLEQNDKPALDECISSLLNTDAEGCIGHISKSGLGVVVKDIALATPVAITKTAKRLALVLCSEWMGVIRKEHRRCVSSRMPVPTRDGFRSDTPPIGHCERTFHRHT
jgi:hypothetical protein